MLLPCYEVSIQNGNLHHPLSAVGAPYRFSYRTTECGDAVLLYDIQNLILFEKECASDYNVGWGA